MAGLARRTVLRGSMAAALAALTGVAATATAGATADVGTVTRAAFENATAARVRFFGPQGVATGTLRSVSDLRHAPAGHPEAFAVLFQLHPGAEPAPGLVDIELDGLRVTGVGLLIVGAPADRSVVALIDRRPVAEHLAHRTNPLTR